jgi:hypothetical protein
MAERTGKTAGRRAVDSHGVMGSRAVSTPGAGGGLHASHEKPGAVSRSALLSMILPWETITVRLRRAVVSSLDAIEEELTAYDCEDPLTTRIE